MNEELHLVDLEMTVAIMSPEGQILIPEEIRKKLGFEPGQKFEIEIMSDNSILIIAIPEDVFSALELPDVETLERALIEERKKDNRENEQIIHEMEKI